jgi:hypothetical protein
MVCIPISARRLPQPSLPGVFRLNLIHELRFRNIAADLDTFGFGAVSLVGRRLHRLCRILGLGGKAGA